MNAAAKVINQGNLFNGHWADMHLTKSMYLLFVLISAILISALAVVYTTNSYRSTFSQVEQQQQQSHKLELQWGQLLLEQASLATPARVEELARVKLDMDLPSSQHTYWLQKR